MKFELIGTPKVEAEYSDEYETTMVADVRREDGVTGDVWIVAGVPDYMRGSSDAARTQQGYQRVRVFGDCPDHWCPKEFACDEDGYGETAVAVVAACESAALAVHEARRVNDEDEL